MAFGGFAPMPLRLGGSSAEGWAPEQHARFCADLVAVKRTAPLARFTFTKSGASITIGSYFGVNGAGSSYAPTLTDGGTGITKVAWAATSFDDEYGVTQPFRIRHAIVGIHGTTDGTGSYKLNTLSVPLVIYTFDNADAAVDCTATVTIF